MLFEQLERYLFSLIQRCHIMNYTTSIVSVDTVKFGSQIAMWLVGEGPNQVRTVHSDHAAPGRLLGHCGY